MDLFPESPMELELPKYDSPTSESTLFSISPKPQGRGEINKPKVEHLATLEGAEGCSGVRLGANRCMYFTLSYFTVLETHHRCNIGSMEWQYWNMYKKSS